MKYAARTKVALVWASFESFCSARCVITMGPVLAGCCAPTDERNTTWGTRTASRAAA